MTDATMDIWLDSARYGRETRAELRDKLVQTFKLPTQQADVLINGNSHRIKRACSPEEAEKLSQQFSSWGIDLRIEVTANSKEVSTGVKAGQGSEDLETDSAFTLAPHGDSIPNLARDKTPPNVTTDHLHLRPE